MGEGHKIDCYRGGGVPGISPPTSLAPAQNSYILCIQVLSSLSAHGANEPFKNGCGYFISCSPSHETRPTCLYVCDDATDLTSSSSSSDPILSILVIFKAKLQKRFFFLSGCSLEGPSHRGHGKVGVAGRSECTGWQNVQDESV